MLNVPWLKIDPRTRLLLGLMAMAAMVMARHPLTIVAESIFTLAALPLFRLTIPWLRSLRLVLPMLALVFTVSLIAFDLQLAGLITLRLCSLYTLSLILFHTVSLTEMSAALQKLGMPYEFSFILTTALTYVPLMGQKIGHIMDAQQSRGIDLRLRLKNAKNFMALFAPLLIQSFMLADELAMAMQLRGFGSSRRTSRRQYRLTAGDYLLMTAGLILLIALYWWERRQLA